MNASEFKAARLTKKLTQKECATMLGVSLSSVTKYEGGAPVPDWVAEKMATPRTSLQIKGLTASEIMALEKRAAAKGISGDEIAAELIRSFLKLSVIAFVAFHGLRTPLDWSAKALKSSAKAGVAMIKSL